MGRSFFGPVNPEPGEKVSPFAKSVNENVRYKYRMHTVRIRLRA